MCDDHLSERSIGESDCEVILQVIVQKMTKVRREDSSRKAWWECETHACLPNGGTDVSLHAVVCVYYGTIKCASVVPAAMSHAPPWPGLSGNPEAPAVAHGMAIVVWIPACAWLGPFIDLRKEPNDGKTGILAPGDPEKITLKKRKKLGLPVDAKLLQKFDNLSTSKTLNIT